MHYFNSITAITLYFESTNVVDFGSVRLYHNSLCNNQFVYIYCSMNVLKLTVVFLVVCVALAPMIDALEEEEKEVTSHFTQAGP